MFFQLSEIDKLNHSIQQLEKSKTKIQHLVNNSYTSESKVKKSLTDIVNQILNFATSRVEMFDRIDKDANNGDLVPSFINFQTFTSERHTFPQWTKTVFEKEYEKQKKSLDLMAKKIYHNHGLAQYKDRHSQQLIGFSNICNRFHALSQHHETIDIMSQAQKMKNLSRMTTEKYISYLNVIASKVQGFVQEVTSKCSNFGHELNNIASKSVNNWVYPQTDNKMRTSPTRNIQAQSKVQIRSGENWLTRANRTLQKGFYSRTKASDNYLLKQPKPYSTYISDFYY